MFIAHFENTMRNAKPQFAEVDGTNIRSIIKIRKEMAAERRVNRQREILAWKERAEELHQRIEAEKQQAIQKYLETQTTVVADIIAYIAAVHGFTSAELLSKRRNRDLCAARHQAIRAVADARPELSTPQIGRHFKRDHTTILHALAKTSGSMKRKRAPALAIRSGEQQS